MKRFRLNITDKFEDRPRLITAYGRVKGGEVGFVLRPVEHSVLFVHIAGETARAWHPVTVSRKCDAPGIPTDEISAKDAVAMIRSAQHGTRKRGLASFRGQWTGVLIYNQEQPRVELRRKLASYGWLRIHSDEAGWHWRFERQGKWFAGDAIDGGGPLGTLDQAIDAGVAGGTGLVREACSVRDTTRKTMMEEPPLEAPVGPKPVARQTSAKTSTPKRTRRPNAALRPKKPVSDAAEMETQDELLLAAFTKALDQALAA